MAHCVRECGQHMLQLSTVAKHRIVPVAVVAGDGRQQSIRQRGWPVRICSSRRRRRRRCPANILVVCSKRSCNEHILFLKWPGESTHSPQHLSLQQHAAFVCTQASLHSTRSRRHYAGHGGWQHGHMQSSAAGVDETCAAF